MKQNTGRISRRRMLGRSGAALAALGMISTAGFGDPQTVEANERGEIMSERPAAPKPVIVLVHGDWSDGSAWSKVISQLQEDHYTVIAPAISLSSLSVDIAALRKILIDLAVPILLVGHSYGGAVITGAATGLPNVKGLFYMCGWAFDQGESILSMNAQFDKDYGPTPLAQYFRPDGPVDADHPQTLLYLDRANFGKAFVQDIDPKRAAVLGAAQRAPTVLSFGEPLQVEPAWKTIRSWYQVSKNDRAISPDGERFFAKRMHAEKIELESSHPAMLSQPEKIAKLIKQAAIAVT